MLRQVENQEVSNRSTAPEIDHPPGSIQNINRNPEEILPHQEDMLIMARRAGRAINRNISFTDMVDRRHNSGDRSR